TFCFVSLYAPTPVLYPLSLHDALPICFIALSLALIFVLIPLVLSKTLKLDLEKDTTIATVRSIIQLFIVGYILKFVFSTESYLRSEEHTSELQSRENIVCRLLLEKKT